MKKSIVRQALVAGMVAVAICSLAGCGGDKAAKSYDAEIEAARMEARRAAREIVTVAANDSLELERRLLDAKAIQSRYLIEKRQDCAAAFDSAFISTIRAVRPDIAEKLK